jgi:raffinose/stachyose/melibiose transport system substrate-binding protein
MHTRRGFISILVLSLVFSTLLPACAKPASSNIVEIEFYQQKSEVVEIVDEIIADFEAKNPNIRVKQVNVPEDAGTVLHNRLSNNDEPDIFSDWFSEDFYVKVEAGHVKELTSTGLLGYVIDNYTGKVNYKGKYYMIPVSLNTMGVFYNVDIFKKYNLSTPTTLDELWAVSNTLKENGITPIAAADKESWTLTHWGLSLMGMYLPNYGEDFVKLYAGKTKGEDVAGISDFADIFLKRSEYVQEDAIGTPFDASLGMFANGQAAMMLQGTWEIPVLQSANPNLNYEIFPFPAKTAQDTRVMVGVDYGLSLAAHPKSPEREAAAIKFLQYFLEHGGQIYADKDGSISCLKNVTMEKSKYPLIMELINEGKTFNWPDFDYWGTATYGEVAVSLQNLVISKDKVNFYKEFQRAFEITEPSTYQVK